MVGEGRLGGEEDPFSFARSWKAGSVAAAVGERGGGEGGRDAGSLDLAGCGG
jgi:hypothetical protein